MWLNEELLNKVLDTYNSAKGLPLASAEAEVKYKDLNGALPPSNSMNSAIHELERNGYLVKHDKVEKYTNSDDPEYRRVMVNRWIRTEKQGPITKEEVKATRAKVASKPSFDAVVDDTAVLLDGLNDSLNAGIPISEAQRCGINKILDKINHAKGIPSNLSGYFN